MCSEELEPREVYARNAVSFCRRFVPSMSELECIHAYEIYLSYRSEGQNAEVSRQYAGLC